MTRSLTGVALVVLSAICFSAKAVFAKLAYGLGADASTVLTLRMGFALPFFLASALAVELRAPARLRRGDWLRLCLLGSLGYYLAAWLDFLGLRHTTASLERLILFLYPTLVVGLNAVLFRERPPRGILTALILSYGGVSIAATAHGLSLGSDAMHGCVLVFGGALAYAFYLSGSQPLIARLGSRRVTGHVLVIACLCVIAQFLIEGDFARLRQPPKVLMLGAATGLVATVIPAFALTAAIARVGSSRASVIGSVGPVATFALSWAFLGEAITWREIAGSVLVLLGVGLTSRHPQRTTSRREPRNPHDAREGT